MYDLSPDTIRFYEKKGLIGPIQRTKSGIRNYSEQDLKRIEFIKCMREADLPIDVLKKYVVENKCNLGIAYDGDGDRCLAVDENGEEIDGDRLIAIISKYLKEKGKLANNAIVATVMSNLGLKKYAEENGITIKQTKVGDRYVLEEMLKNGYNIGGEQSGHVILLDYNPTGDGILTSLMLIRVMLESNKSASELCKIIKMYPQVLVNAKIDSKKKKDYETDDEIQTEIRKLEEEFSGNGRVLIRPSGTEPLIRVMLELSLIHI